MTRNILILAAAGGSLALLLSAFGFQHLAGLAPCKLCLWQRWPHAAAVVIGALALLRRDRVLPSLGAIAALSTAGIGFYHAGVEAGWWQGPTTCSSAPISGLSPQQLMDQIMGAPLVRCDDIPWQMLGLSMAGWNAVSSALLALLWIAATRRSGP